MKRAVPGDGKVTGDKNEEEGPTSPSWMFTDELRCEASEMSGVTAAAVTKLGLGVWLSALRDPA